MSQHAGIGCETPCSKQHNMLLCIVSMWHVGQFTISMCDSVCEFSGSVDYTCIQYIYRAHKFFTNPYASCSDCCIVLCGSWSVVVVLAVVECCCWIPYWLALMLVLTFAPFVLTFAPCALAFALCACGIILLSTSASTPLAHMVVVTGCNLRWWRFSFSHWRNTPCTSGSIYYKYIVTYA